MPEPLTNCSKCNEEFERRSLACPSCGTVHVQHLYKYRRFDLYSLPSLIERTLWCPSVASLNDPFEFAFSLSEMHVEGVPIKAASLLQAREEMMDCGVLSLSEVNNDLLMWSHYAAAHTGYCMEFKRSSTNDLGTLGRCNPVIYAGDYPTYTAGELEDASIVARLMTSKARNWSYELEWRLLTRPGNTSHPFPGELTRIIFGSRMQSAFRKAIAAILGDSVAYGEALISSMAYTVDISPIPISDLR